ncbi:MAG: nodulation S family protein [Verrucomicrobiota bacterium]|nr:nodulation S family protein [Verrucomicrobiota bacterium]
MESGASTCDERYRASSDPWGFRTRYYERRKREIVVASLTRAKFQSCWELGCSNGELTAALAPRCAHILATDGNDRAVVEARGRLAEFAHVEVEHQIHPDDWPEAQFDLIVFSELAYNFTAAVLREMALRLRASLQPEGVLVACHWRYPIEGCELTGDAAHRIIAEVLALPRLVTHTEADFILEIWSADARSVAGQEGMV